MTITSILPAFPPAYVYGFEPVFSAGATSFYMHPGKCRDSADSNNIIIQAPITIDLTKKGLNGLDAGVLLAANNYYIYAIGSSTGYLPSGYITSLSDTAPILPAGYDLYRYVRFMQTNPGAAHTAGCYQLGNGNSIKYIFHNIRQVLLSGNATTFTAFSLTAFLPPSIVEVGGYMDFTPNTAGNLAEVTSYGSFTDVPYLCGPVAGQASSSFFSTVATMNGDDPSLVYKVSETTDSLDIWLQSFVYYI